MTQALELVDARDPRVERIWTALEAESDASYFLSWGWISNWLKAVPRPPKLAVISERGVPVVAFFLGQKRISRPGVLSSNALFLNTTGSDAYDELCIEHNGVLAKRPHASSLANLIKLLPGSWDELFMPGIDKTAFDDLETLPGYRVKIDKDSAAPYIDLERVRGAKDGYVSLLGSSTRTQLRRSRRTVGDIELEVASDLSTAMDIYAELLRLHEKRWNATGQAGAFADPWFEQFHRRLITNRLPLGEIQLVRVRAKGQTVGCLYNFVFRGRILFYQSGLGHYEDPHVKPGFLTHAAAVEYNAKLGHAVYDLLGGDSRYKAQLGTDEARLVWARVQRPLLRFSIEDRLRTAKRMIVAVRPRLLALRPS